VTLAALFGVEIGHGRFGQGVAAVKPPERLTFSAAVAAIDRQDLKALQVLLDEGLNPNAKDSDDRTLLMSAAGIGFVEGVRVLLGSGADLEAKTDDGLSALQHAAMALSDESVRLLLEAGADPNVRTKNGDTAIAVAKDRLRPRFTLRSPFSERHVILTLPAWNIRHPVIDRLTHASKEQAAASRARK
jgi:Ankyrin repeats (3 copies)